jgi:ABC-type nitrate/sulfonate/bicarbonate transport system substrate-binding protein
MKNNRFTHRSTLFIFFPYDLFRVAAVATLCILLTPLAAGANPYLARPGETPLNVKVATCAVSGGFVHLYTAMDNGLFEKYGFRVSHSFIAGGSAALAALASGDIQILYCAADATIPGLATGIDGKVVGAPLIGLPYVLISRKELTRVEDLKGKSVGISRPGDLDDRLVKALLKKANLSAAEVPSRPVGGSQGERYTAMAQGIVDAVPVTPPLDARAKKDGFNVIYQFNDLKLPFIYSSVHVTTKTLKENPTAVQRFVAAMAEALFFVEKNPDKAKASLGKVLKISESEVLQSAYDAYALKLVNRNMTVPGNAVAEAVEVARENGTSIRKKPAELFDNRFAEELDKSGFLKELWGAELR